MKFKILLIEDNRMHSQLFKDALTESGHEVSVAFNGIDGLNTIFLETYDLVLLDLVLPDIEGHSIIQSIRQHSSTPIMVISSKSKDIDKVHHLNLGADDYLVKPFSLDELTARVNALLRRAKLHPTTPNVTIKNGNTTIEIDAYLIYKNGVKLDLTKKQVKILKFLALHVNTVVNKKDLHEYVWNTEYKGDDNLMNVSVFRLRHLVEDDPKNPKIITSIWGVGFMLVSNEKAS